MSDNGKHRLNAGQEAARVKSGAGGGQFGKSAAKRVAEHSVVDNLTWDAADPSDEALEALEALEAPHDGEARPTGDAYPMPTPPEFMTPRDILTHYAPLDNDRLYWYENGRGSTDHDETDEQFWARKAREAKTNTRRDRFPTDINERPPAPSEAAPGFENLNWISSYPTPEHATLFDDIAANGVRAPVSLQRDPNAVGSTGKPEILGGLHRVAVMVATHPDTPIPVAFFDSLQDAKDRLGDSF